MKVNVKKSIDFNINRNKKVKRIEINTEIKKMN